VARRRPPRQPHADCRPPSSGPSILGCGSSSG
jgi:hypothetical protein